MKLTDDAKQRVEQLIEVCHQENEKKWDERRDYPFTGYSDPFLEAVTEMYLIFEESGKLDPLLWLGQTLRKAGVSSHHGKHMSQERITYLYEEHIKWQLRWLKNVKLQMERDPTNSQK